MKVPVCAVPLAVLAWAAACTPPHDAPAQDTVPQATLETHCYLQVTPNAPAVVDGDSFPVAPDSLYIRLDLLGDLATGVYQWLPAEKDRMTGSFKGDLTGSTVFALYTYEAEGMRAKQEVAFRMVQGGLRIGSGDRTEVDGITVFKDRNALTFGQAVPEVPCR